MTAPDRQLLTRFAEALRQEFSTASIWAFGSRASGMPAAESDLDVCVVLDALGPESRLRISDIAWEIGFAAGIVISTVVFERQHFENGPCSVSPLVREIRRSAVTA